MLPPSLLGARRTAPRSPAAAHCGGAAAGTTRPARQRPRTRLRRRSRSSAPKRLAGLAVYRPAFGLWHGVAQDEQAAVCRGPCKRIVFRKTQAAQFLESAPNIGHICADSVRQINSRTHNSRKLHSADYNFKVDSRISLAPVLGRKFDNLHWIHLRRTRKKMTK